MAAKTKTQEQKTIAHQWLITQYTDGTSKITEVRRKDAYAMPRENNGHFISLRRDASARQEGKAVTPDPMVTCPYCGRSFRVGQKNVQ